MGYWLGRAWLSAFGWKVEGGPPAAKKAVVVALLENGAGLGEWNECGTFQ